MKVILLAICLVILSAVLLILSPYFLASFKPRKFINTKTGRPMPGTSRFPAFPLGDFRHASHPDRHIRFKSIADRLGDVFYSFVMYKPAVIVVDTDLLFAIMAQDTGKYERDITLAPAMCKAIRKCDSGLSLIGC